MRSDRHERRNMSFLIENGVLEKYTNDDNLTDVIIPDGVYTINCEAFQAADNIVSVTVPEGVKIIGNLAFCKCENLTTVILPESIIRIGEGAFSHCHNLASINTLGQITHISSHAFYECSALASITIPDGVRYIGECAFSHCGLLARAKLPDSVEFIDAMAFGSCKELSDFSIPPRVREIGRYAFVECVKISNITLPPAVRVIEEGTFASCKGLAEVKIPDGVEVIRNSAFNSCFHLSKINIPTSVTKIELFAFYKCRDLRKLTIPQNGMEIMFSAFSECENLVTNFSIKEWDRIWGVERPDYALNYMRNFKAGDPFFENTKEENKRYIRQQLHNILKKDINNDTRPYGIRPDDTNVIIFLIDEIKLRFDEVEALLDKVRGNPEASALLLDYRKRNFPEDYLEKYEYDKLQKELGLIERTVAEWKKIFRLGDDGNGGYMILGYKGKDTSIEIPEKIGKKPVTAIGDLAFSPETPYLKQEIRGTLKMLETVIIPDSVTAIGTDVFRECQNLSIVYREKTFTPDEFKEYCRQNVPKPI